MAAGCAGLNFLLFLCLIVLVHWQDLLRGPPPPPRKTLLKLCPPPCCPTSCPQHPPNSVCESRTFYQEWGCDLCAAQQPHCSSASGGHCVRHSGEDLGCSSAAHCHPLPGFSLESRAVPAAFLTSSLPFSFSPISAATFGLFFLLSGDLSLSPGLRSFLLPFLGPLGKPHGLSFGQLVCLVSRSVRSLCSHW